MTRTRKANLLRRPAKHAEAVGTADFRANLAKYLKMASTGRPVIVQERSRNAFVLSRIDDEQPSSIVGCMRDRTECSTGAVVNAREQWRAGEMP